MNWSRGNTTVVKAVFPVRYVWLDKRQEWTKKERRDGEKMRREVKASEETKKGGGNNEMLLWSCYLATFFIYFLYPFMALWLKLSSFK